MKKTVVLAVLLVSGIIFYSTDLYAQNLYYVQSVKAKVMSSTSFKAPVLGEVAKGYKFTASGREGSWVKVKFNEREGYVSSLVLSTHPPLEKTGVIKADDGEIKQGVRRRASSYTSAAAARGLAQDDRRRLSKEEKVDYDSLDKIEAFMVTPEELGRFMEGQQL
jgi:uncharacterized protein YgiM (DUF1202 family)